MEHNFEATGYVINVVKILHNVLLSMRLRLFEVDLVLIPYEALNLGATAHPVSRTALLQAPTALKVSSDVRDNRYFFTSIMADPFFQREKCLNGPVWPVLIMVA